MHFPTTATNLLLYWPSRRSMPSFLCGLFATLIRKSRSHRHTAPPAGANESLRYLYCANVSLRRVRLLLSRLTAGCMNCCRSRSILPKLQLCWQQTKRRIAALSLLRTIGLVFFWEAHSNHTTTLGLEARRPTPGMPRLNQQCGAVQVAHSKRFWLRISFASFNSKSVSKVGEQACSVRCLQGDWCFRCAMPMH